MVLPAILCTSLTLFTAATPYVMTLAPHGNCTLCCPVDFRKHVKFNLYTRSNPDKPYRLYLNDYSGLMLSPIGRNNPTVVYIHGFTELDGGQSPVAIRKAHLERGEYNVVIVDWSALSAFPWYEQAVHNTPEVGKYVARFLNFVTGVGGVHLASLHIIGFSLGAEIAGFIGKSMLAGARLPRITGLDPAFPLYMFSSMRGHLSKTDADFVDVIHTDGGVFGFPVPLGHADFFPNGGTPIQPGCRLPELILHSELQHFIACSHNRAWKYYAETVYNEHAFRATPCRNYHLFLLNKCPGDPIIGVAYDRPQPDAAYMGIAAHPYLRGKFYLKTNQVQPYGRSA